MIELSTGTVNILYADGTAAAFDPDGLRLRLEQSFAASGRAEPWLAGELALAVEYALRRRTADMDGQPPEIRAEDVDHCVIRILKDAGYDAAVEHFRIGGPVSGDSGKLAPGDIESFLADKLHLTGEPRQNLTRRIRRTMSAIGAAKCSPRLALELARHFREEDASSHRLSAPTVTPPAPTALEPGAEENNSCRVRRSDSIFPSIRAEINLPALFAGCKLIPPLMEFSLIPLLQPAAEWIGKVCARLRSGRAAAAYPLLLTIHGFPAFASQWLCYESDADAETSAKRQRRFATLFCSLIREPPFKVILR